MEKLIKVININDDSGLNQAEIHHWDQALPTCQHFSVVTIFCQVGKGLIHRSGSEILERSWFHIEYDLLMDWAESKRSFIARTTKAFRLVAGRFSSQLSTWESPEKPYFS